MQMRIEYYEAKLSLVSLAYPQKERCDYACWEDAEPSWAHEWASEGKGGITAESSRNQ